MAVCGASGAKECKQLIIDAVAKVVVSRGRRWAIDASDQERLDGACCCDWHKLKFYSEDSQFVAVFLGHREPVWAAAEDGNSSMFTHACDAAPPSVLPEIVEGLVAEALDFRYNECIE
jgi:hypothetical protein